MSAFETEIPVRFEHVDAWGIVFYPRYFEMFSEVVETWFEEALGVTFRRLHDAEKTGIPLVDVHCRFMHPSRLSDRLRFVLTVTRVGRSSVSLNLRAFGGGEQRLEADMTLVYARQDSGRAASRKIPPELAEKMRAYLVSDAKN